jgi:hypothetical protein
MLNMDGVVEGNHRTSLSGVCISLTKFLFLFCFYVVLFYYFSFITE